MNSPALPMRILITGWLGAGSTEVANKLAALREIEVFNSARAIRDLIAERGESFQIFETETRSGEYDLDYLLRNKTLK
jgi:cytidylate kinase